MEFAQLGVIIKIRNQVAETVAVAESYLIINSCKNKESKKPPLRIYLPVKLADGRMSIKKENISSCLIYKIVSLSKMARKAEPFLGKISSI